MASSLAPGTIVAGRYRIRREIGRGAMGVVYVAEHLNTGGLCALKVMLEAHFVAERAARFRREARASARIVSDHVIKVNDADIAPELGDAPFLVMELLEGEDLEQELAARGPLPPAETLDVLTQVARGLERAHAAGVIHRDLKPENVFRHRRDDGSAIYKVLDFGISKVLSAEPSLSMTGTADIMGTPLYMSPEQASARHDLVGPATDIWALGIMAVRILTGEIYWQGQNLPEIFFEIMATERTPPSTRFPHLSPAFDAWFSKSCACRPSDRFESVTAQVAALAFAFEQPSLATVAVATPVMQPLPFVATTTARGALSRSTPPPPMSRLQTAALAIAAILVVGFVTLAALLARDEERATVRPDAGVVLAAAAVEAPALAVMDLPSAPVEDAGAPLRASPPPRRAKPVPSASKDLFDTPR